MTRRRFVPTARSHRTQSRPRRISRRILAISAEKQKSWRTIAYWMFYIWNASQEPAIYYAYSPESDNMIVDGLDTALSLAKRVETKVRQLTHGRIRNLVVEEIQGQVIVSGQAPPAMPSSLPLHGALELLSGEMFAEKITIG